MDDLLQAVSRLDLTSTTTTAEIETAFDRITSYVHTFRNITEDEITVTKALAYPFTPGGIVFFLLEPLDTHPWESGVEAVISSCPTLESLAEGLYLSSNRELNLIDDVTVLDLRAFVSTGVKRSLRHQKLADLYELVFGFLYKKRPDVILGMGSDVRKELHNRYLKFSPSTEIIYTKHPSHVVNYHPEDRSKRRDLLAKINEAVRHHTRNSNPRDHDWNLNQKLVPDALKILLAPEAKRLQHYPAPTAKMMKLLRRLSEIWFSKPEGWPSLNLTPDDGYFSLRYDQTQQLKTCATTTNSSSSPIELFEAGMAKLIMALNDNIKLASWYLDSYEVNWKRIALGVNSAMTLFERAYGFQPEFEQKYIALLKPGKRTLSEIVADGVMDIGYIKILMARPMGGQ